MSRRPDMTKLHRGTHILRTLPVLLALVYAWAQVAAWYTWLRAGSEPGSDYLLAFIVTATLLLGVTVLVLAGLRVATLRRALLPLELSLVVAAVVLVAGERGTNIDTESDVFAIALLFSAGSLVVLSFLAVLLDGRRSRGPWLAGVAAVIAAFGLAVPAALELLDSRAGAGIPTHEQVASSELTSAFEPSGLIRLGFGHSLYGPYGEHVVDGGRAMLLADRDGTLTFGLALPHGFRGAYVAELRRGSCTDDGARSRVARFSGRWPRAVGQFAEHSVGTLTLHGIAATEQLHARWGSGRPLDDVRCADLLDPRRVAVAHSGGAEFFARCIAPLGMQPGTHVRLTPASMQDGRCAKDMADLIELSSSQPYETRRSADDTVRCLADRGVRSVVHEVAGGYFVPITGPQQPDTGFCYVPASGAPTSGIPLDPAVGLPVDPAAGPASPAPALVIGPNGEIAAPGGGVVGTPLH